VRSLTLRLALPFCAIVIAAVAIVYLGVAPSLRSNLRDTRLKTLADSGKRVAPPIRQALDASLSTTALDRRVRRAADASGARVTLLSVAQTGRAPRLDVRSDSNDEANIDLQFGVAERAARTGRIERGTEAGEAGRLAEVALPLRITRPGARRPGVFYVAVFSQPLQDVSGGVEKIRRRILIAGAIALAFAILAGILVASSVSRRVRRMERAARSVAAGDFSARFDVTARDELGALARTLDGMQRQLAELETARSRFIATASHELRTPIFSIGGFLELLEDEELDEETRVMFIRQVREQVDRLGRLATDLLDLSRLEAGSLELRPERTDLREIARAVAAEFGPALAAHESHLELRFSTTGAEADCDPERVAQIMRILIDNALSHTPAGTDVVVAASQRDGRVRLSVTDYGTGIKRAAMSRIFEPFFTSDDAQGSGLGLAIAHELAERMAGELQAESVPGRTTFSLELPA
jgi:two-component system OmpR family sensor kinase